MYHVLGGAYLGWALGSNDAANVFGTAVASHMVRYRTAVLLAAGEKGKRLALPNARIMIHQGSAGFHGTPSDIDIIAKEVLRYKSLLVELLAKHSGQPVEKVEKDIDRDFYMSPDEAVEYGIVDKMLTGESE